MIDLTPIVYIMLVGLGLIGAQAALSDKRLMLILSSPPPLANSGYSRDVIEDLFLGELEEVFNTTSAIATPDVASVREKTILSALADIGRVGDLAFAIQQRLGNNPYKVTANFVAEGNKTMVLLSGSLTKASPKLATSTPINFSLVLMSKPVKDLWHPARLVATTSAIS